MLQQHGEYAMPTAVPANEFLNLEGRKLSTSKNWAVWLHEYLAGFPWAARCIALCVDRDDARNKGQRLHVGRFPNTQQQ